MQRADATLPVEHRHRWSLPCSETPAPSENGERNMPGDNTSQLISVFCFLGKKLTDWRAKKHCPEQSFNFFL